MSTITISKATLTHGLFLKVSYEEHLPGNSTRNHPNMTSTDPVHDDLINIFKQLPAHMALICEEITNEDFIDSLPEDNETRQDYVAEFGETVPAISAKKVRGKQASIVPDINKTATVVKAVDKFNTHTISIKGGLGIDQVSLDGTRELTTLKIKGVSSPTIKLIQEEYRYAEDLTLLVEALKYEINEFLFNGKKAPEAQQELAFGDGVGLEPGELKTNAYKDPTAAISDKDDDFVGFEISTEEPGGDDGITDVEFEEPPISPEEY